MKCKTLRFDKGFRVAALSPPVEAAEMVLPPFAREGAPQNRHRGADQWLFVVDAFGCASLAGKPWRLHRGAPIGIKHGDRHPTENTGDSSLRRLNSHMPPARRPAGQELEAARP